MKNISTGTLLFLCAVIFSLSNSLCTAPATAQDKAPLPHEVNTLLKDTNEVFYSIRAEDRLIGYSAYKVQRTLQLAGESFIKFQSLSRIKTGIGSIEDLTFNSEFSLSRLNLQPAYLQLKQSSSQGDIFSETVFSNGVIAQKSMLGKNLSSAIIPVDHNCYMLSNNLWGRIDTFVEHYLTMIVLCRSGISRISVFDPILRTVGTIEIISGREETVELAKRTFKCREYTMKDYYGIPIMTVWYDLKGGKIVRMTQVGGGLTFELSSRRVALDVEKAKGIDFSLAQTIPSPLYFSEPEKVETLKLEGHIQGRGIVNLNHKINGFEQQFTGTSTELEATGTFEVKTSKPVIDKPGPFPLKAVPEDIAPYLKAQSGIESDNEIIKNKAMEITWKSKDAWVAVGKINKWLKDNIKTGIALPAASFSFINGIGNSESRSMLGTAMCRAIGVPARLVGGMAFKDGDFIPHSWFEVYIEGNGWIPLDPDEGSDNRIDATRIYLWEFGDVNSAAITSIDFGPRPPQTVSFYNKDLTWPVGEERTFRIKKGDTVIGEEKALVEDINMEEGKESYTFSSTSSLDVGGNPFKATGKLIITPNVLPLEFNYQSEMSGVTQTQHFKFEKGYISQIMEGREGERKRDIPYSRGTYLIDQRFLSQWALVIGQIPRPQLGKKYTFTVFVPEDLKTREIELEVKNYEKVEAGDQEYDVFRCESKKGMIFYIDNTGKVVKIALPPQELEIDLITAGTKIRNEQRKDEGTNEKNNL